MLDPQTRVQGGAGLAVASDLEISTQNHVQPSDEELIEAGLRPAT